jgi:D-amino-acid oxidase
MKNTNVLIIGAGVIGLTTAYSLLLEGYKVTIIAKEFSPNITSNVAGALWEWPPAVCGYHSDLISLDRSKDWCMTSYDKFYELSKNEETGVFIKEVCFFFRQPVLENHFHSTKMNELKGKVKGFKHDSTIIQDENINQNIGLIDAYKHEAPMVDTDIYMEWLMNQVVAMGCTIQQREIKTSLSNIEHKLLDDYRCNYLVNCSGLGSATLADEFMYPLRGALVRIKNIGKNAPKLDKAYCVSFDEETREQDIVFIVPRGRNTLILGALAEEGEWNLNINLDNYKPIREMFERCKEFLPALRRAEIDENEPVRVGLRPFRRENVRLDWEKGTRIIHNYGHGGAGVTFSWGCANEVAQMIRAQIAANSTVSIAANNK